MLIDTDVIIWYMRGHEKARRLLERSAPFAISAVTYMELVQGMRNQAELRQLRRSVQQWQVKLLSIDETICARAILYVENHFLSHSVRLADALVAATAVTAGLRLVTANVKHYAPIKELQVRRFRPKPLIR